MFIQALIQPPNTLDAHIEVLITWAFTLIAVAGMVIGIVFFAIYILQTISRIVLKTSQKYSVLISLLIILFMSSEACKFLYEQLIEWLIALLESNYDNWDFGYSEIRIATLICLLPTVLLMTTIAYKTIKWLLKGPDKSALSGKQALAYTSTYFLISISINIGLITLMRSIFGPDFKLE